VKHFATDASHTSDWVWLIIHEVSIHTTVGRTPLDEWSAHHRDLYVTTLTTHKSPFPPGGIRTHVPSRWVAADLRLRPRGHWERLKNKLDRITKWLWLILNMQMLSDLRHVKTSRSLRRRLNPRPALNDAGAPPIGR